MQKYACIAEISTKVAYRVTFYVHPVHYDNFNVAPNSMDWMRQRHKMNESSAVYDPRDEMRPSGITLPRRREIKRASR